MIEISNSKKTIIISVTITNSNRSKIVKLSYDVRYFR